VARDYLGLMLTTFAGRSVSVHSMIRQQKTFILTYNIRPNVPKPSTSGECHNLTFGPRT